MLEMTIQTISMLTKLPVYYDNFTAFVPFLHTSLHITLYPSPHLLHVCMFNISQTNVVEIIEIPVRKSTVGCPERGLMSNQRLFRHLVLIAMREIVSHIHQNTLRPLEIIEWVVKCLFSLLRQSYISQAMTFM